MPANSAAPDQVLLCRLDQLADGQSRGFNVRGAALFAVRQRQQVYVYRNRCPHLGIPLEWLPDRFLDAGGELIQCSTHGALFTIDDGLCVSGPCSGQSLQPVPVTVNEGQVWVEVPTVEAGPTE